MEMLKDIRQEMQTRDKQLKVQLQLRDECMDAEMRIRYHNLENRGMKNGRINWNKEKKN